MKKHKENKLKFIIPIIFIFIFFSFTSAQGFIPPQTNSFKSYTGNLTNLSELQDVYISTPSANDFLRYDDATGKWIVYPFALSDYWNFDYGDLINSPTALSDFTDDILWTSGFNTTGDTRWLLISNWNSTNSSYYLDSNPYGFYNSTTLTNNNQLLNGNGFYNSTDFSIADYLLLSNWNSTNSSYLTSEVNWNANYSLVVPYTVLNNGSYFNVAETDPYWTGNYSTFLTHITWANVMNGTLALNSTFGNYFTKSDILGFNYYNSTTLPSRVSGSGTAWYIPMWNGTTSLNNSAIAQNGSNIGIGTTSPGDKLQVAGGIRSDTGYYLKNSGGSYPGVMTITSNKGTNTLTLKDGDGNAPLELFGNNIYFSTAGGVWSA